MLFKGISKRFCTAGGQQYQAIGDFWDYFAKEFGRENLDGLGLNWQEDSLEYIIGSCDKTMFFDFKKIKEKYPEASYKEIVLPEEGWKVYKGRTDSLGKIYEEIYKDGPLQYEIESFTEDGNCCVRIKR